MTPETFEPRTATAAANPATTTLQTKPEAGIGEALLVLRKRKYFVIVAALLGFAYGWYQARVQPIVYVATGTIEIRSGSSAAFRVDSSGIGGSDSNGIPTQAVILKSDTLLLIVARDLDLANNPEFWGIKGPMPHRNIDDPNVRQSTIGVLFNSITITPIVKTDIIRISCTTANPTLSADIINRLVNDYSEHSLQMRKDATERTAKFLTHQLDTLKKDVEDSQTQVAELGKRIGVVGFDPSHNQITTDLQSLNSAVDASELNRILADNRYKILSEMEPEALSNPIDLGKGPVVDQTSLAALQSQRDGIQVQIAQLSTHLGPQHPQIKLLRAQDAALAKAMSVEENRILNQARQQYSAAKTNETQTRNFFGEETAKADKLSDDLARFNLLQHQYDANRSLYEGLVEKLRTAEIQTGLESTEIDIVDQATPPIGPTLQPRSTMLLINTMVMLIFGIIVAFVVDALDTGIQTVAELETITGLPSLALIPRARRIADPSTLSVAQRNLTVLSSPKSQFSEAFRALRTSLLLSHPGSEPKVVLLTSATPNEGKTTAAINLSCVLAQRGVRVLLIDADLRRPTVHHRFGINGKVGLTSVLAGSSTLAAAVQSFEEVPSLDILVSGPVPPFPTEMLGSNAMHALLQEARGIYTHIVLDSPPLLSVTDSVVLAREADAVVMIVRHGKSSKHTVRRGREILARAGARVIGCAFNAVDISSPEYYAYYGYSGYSGYSTGVDDASWNPAAHSKSGSSANDEGPSR